MNKIHARRLLKLANFLDALPPKRFDYSTWVGEDWKGKQDLSCGTTACALGWAATIPEFRKLGMRLTKQGFVCLAPCNPDGTSPGAVAASAKVFGLSWQEHGWLFTGGEGPNGEKWLSQDATAKQAARHIRKVVATLTKGPGK